MFPRNQPSGATSAANELFLCRLMKSAAANGSGIDPRRLNAPGRAPAPVARARQVAMYLAHVGFGLGFAAVGRGFDRDPTTVRHACARIESLRGQRRFDRALTALEMSARALALALVGGAGARPFCLGGGV